MVDVKAIFVGHNHNNNFYGNLQCIWFFYDRGFRHHVYDVTDWTKRATVIQVEHNKRKEALMGMEKIRTWKQLDDGVLTEFDKKVLWDFPSIKRKI